MSDTGRDTSRYTVISTAGGYDVVCSADGRVVVSGESFGLAEQICTLLNGGQFDSTMASGDDRSAAGVTRLPGVLLSAAREVLGMNAANPHALCLSFDANAIRDHFADAGDVENIDSDAALVASMTDEELRRVGMLALESDSIYSAFRAALSVALALIDNERELGKDGAE